MSKTINQNRLDDLIASLCAGQGEETLHAIATLFVEKAARKKEPGRSIAKTIPMNLSDRVAPEVQDRVYEIALDMARRLKAERADVEADTRRDSEWMSTTDLSQRMGERRATIEALLMTDPGFRRQCGWPMYFLGEWRIPTAAFDERQARYRSALPVREPHPIPPGCTAQPPVAIDDRDRAPCREVCGCGDGVVAGCVLCQDNG